MLSRCGRVPVRGCRWMSWRGAKECVRYYFRWWACLWCFRHRRGTRRVPRAYLCGAAT